MRYSHSRALNFVLAMFLLFSSVTFGQSERGSIVGTVTDEAGKAVPNVTVTVTNQANKTSQTLTTNAEGIYNVPFLTPGNYEVSATATGFSKTVVSDVVVNVASRESVNITLKVGQVTETVQVSDQAPLLQTENAGVGQVITQQQLADLPSSNRNLYSFLSLDSTVNGQGVNSSNAESFRLESGGTMSIAGGRPSAVTFKIDGQVVGMTTGPVVTQFEVEPAPGIKVARIANLEADLALALRAPSVRIVAPIPGKGAVGVEVPNPAPEMVYFREIVEAPVFRSTKAMLPLALGKDIAGKPYVADLARMPHLLIAGATGSGKSVCVNTIITSLIFRHTPQTLRFLMVDPKMVELSMYNDLPHLRHPVVTDNNDAAAVLKWAVIEMERRYQLLSANGVRNLLDFNARLEGGQLMRSPDPEGEEGDPDRWVYRGGTLPYIVVIIDELADLMMTVQGEVEKPLALLAQKARAIGIHLILATQRPSVNVITGLIKANFPSRIAFRVSSKVDSRTILDQNGADALLGNGDMLLLPPASNEPIRIQGAYLSTDDTEHLMAWYRDQKRLRDEAALAAGEAPPAAREDDILEVVRAHEGDGEGLEAGDDPADRDKLFREAAMLCIQHQGGSTSLLQRRLRIGYGRAARIIDQLHLAGVLGPPDGSKPRDVLVDIIGLDQLCPDD